jgi:hypothetical protein
VHLNLLEWLVTLNITFIVGCLGHSTAIQLWPFIWRLGYSKETSREMVMTTLYLGPLGLMHTTPASPT